MFKTLGPAGLDVTNWPLLTLLVFLVFLTVIDLFFDNILNIPQSRLKPRLNCKKKTAKKHTFCDPDPGLITVKNGLHLRFL